MTVTKQIIIVGGGRVGLAAAKDLENQGHRLTIIEEDGARCDRIMDRTRASVINGDATNPDILQQANLGDTDALLALSGTAGVNLSVCLLAERLGADVRTVLRVDNDDKVGQYDDVVDNVVYPELVGGQRAADFVSPVVNTGSVFGNSSLQLVEVEVLADAPAAGEAVEDVSFPSNTLVVCNEDEPIGGASILQAGERYLVVTTEGALEETLQLLRG